MMNFFVKVVNNLLFFAKNSIIDAWLGSEQSLKIIDFSRQSLGGANHCDCYKV